MDRNISQHDLTVSVVIPAYNSGKYIKSAIESVLTQTSSPEEIIVVDDGSTDNTPNICNLYKNNIIYIRQDNQGASVARNKGIDRASSRWIAFLDADDRWLPDKIEIQRRHLAENPDLQWSYSNFIIVSPDDDKKDAYDIDYCLKCLSGRQYFDDYLAAYLMKIHMLTSTLIVKKQLLADVGMFLVGQLWSQDTDLFFRIAYRCPKTGFIPQPLTLYSMDLPGSITRTNQTKVHQRCRLLERHLDLSEDFNRYDEFKKCASLMLTHWISKIQSIDRKADISEFIERFDHLIPVNFKREAVLKMRYPRLATPAFCIYHKLKNMIRKKT